jgi:hypothetical protein
MTDVLVAGTAYKIPSSMRQVLALAFLQVPLSDLQFFLLALLTNDNLCRGSPGPIRKLNVLLVVAGEALYVLGARLE